MITEPAAEAVAKRLRRLLEQSPSVEQVQGLAVALRDEGVDQPTLYGGFESVLVATAADDPSYDLVADTLDRIHGGPWAKGRDLFDEGPGRG